MDNINKKICYFLSFLNIVDALSTIYLIGIGWGREVNPVMEFLLSKSYWLFLACKLLLSCAIIGVGWNWFKMVQSKLPQYLLWIVTTCYCLVMLAHLQVYYQGFFNV